MSFSVSRNFCMRDPIESFLVALESFRKVDVSSTCSFRDIDVSARRFFFITSRETGYAEKIPGQKNVA